MKNYRAQGDRILHTLTGTNSSGDPVVVGTGLLGILLEPGVNTDVKDAAIEGVFELPKVSAAVIAVGEQVLYDVSVDAVDDDAATPAAGDFLCGVAMETAGAGVLVIDVKINQAGASVT